MRLQRDRHLTLPVAEGWSTALVVLKGSITVNGTTPVNEAQLVVLSQEGENLYLEASSDASVLLLSGEPLNEPIVGYGPFVMNTKTRNRRSRTRFQLRPFWPNLKTLREYTICPVLLILMVCAR
ncbi:Pirin C-terminal cupin domain [Citrobacter koseri]|nr:Pirin C-terminal cupin domain [Citrobacter koseri]